jgi:hypothetical protein
MVITVTSERYDGYKHVLGLRLGLGLGRNKDE